MNLKNIIKQVFKRFNLRIEKINNLNDSVLLNVFKSKFDKRVLLSYIKEPFLNKIDYTHSNRLECYTAGLIFNELGYQVDVAFCNYKGIIDYEKYDVVYGMGTVLENSFYSKKNNLIRIFYATGCSPIYSNIQTTKKLSVFAEKNKLLLPESARFVQEALSMQILIAEAIIVLGNNFVLDTYKRNTIKSKLFNLNAFYFDILDIDLQKKNVSIAKNNFLWFGSTGAIHKGLDIVIEIFSKRKDITLNICGIDSNEKRFIEFMEPIITKNKNIINHGFLNIQSNEFMKLMNNCGFVIFPSVSEGGSPAILNVIANGGLIPIISESCGLDLEHSGWVLDSIDVEKFELAVNEATLMDDLSFLRLAQQSKDLIRKKYTYEIYHKSLKMIIRNILNDGPIAT